MIHLSFNRVGSRSGATVRHSSPDLKYRKPLFYAITPDNMTFFQKVNHFNLALSYAEGLGATTTEFCNLESQKMCLVSFILMRRIKLLLT